LFDESSARTHVSKKDGDMAKRISIEISDDTDGSHADQTVPFGLDGVSYEIDLSNANASALRAAIEPYVAVARRIGGRRIKVAVGQPTDCTTQEPKANTDYTATHDIRAWARQNGYEVADQGRISKVIVEAFHSARRSDSPVAVRAPRPGTTSKQRPKRGKQR
jgi:hypothetical protein